MTKFGRYYDRHTDPDGTSEEETRKMQDPDFRRNILRKVRADIAACGQSVIMVGADEESGTESFAYTVGRHERGLPELIITVPLRPESMQSLLNELDHVMPSRKAAGELVSLGGKFPVMIIEATDALTKSDYTHIANGLYGHRDYDVQQVVLCDEEGVYPPDCAPPWNRQPLLGAVIKPVTN